MSRIPLKRIEDMSPVQREQYDRFPSNLSRALLLTDGRVAGALSNLANAFRASGLDPKLREGVILRVVAHSGSAYERMQHLEQAEKTGWIASETAAIEAGQAPALPARFTAVMAFVDACVAAPRVPDDAFEAAAAVLSHGDLITVILLVGHYMMVARLLATLDVELDPVPDSWASEH
jgi:alkylhydroperoxidase family enzyme